MARCKPYDILAQLVTPLPLLIVNKTFRSLESMQDMELELFIRYLVRFTSKAEELDPDTKPHWWGHDLDFPRFFCSRNRRIPFAKSKLLKMRGVVSNCYIYYGQMELIHLSERLANVGPFHFQLNQNDTVTIYRGDKKVPLVVVPASNLMYAAPLVYGTLTNEGVRKQLASAPVRSSRRTLLQHRVQVLNSDSENEDDCIQMDQTQFSDKENSNRLEFEPDSVALISNEGDGNPDDPIAISLQNRRSVVDLTNDGDDNFVAQCVFLNSMDLMCVNQNPPELPSHPHYLTEKDEKMGIPLKMLNACDVPFLVRMGVLPKACLATKEDIHLYTKLIDAHTHTL